MNLRVSSFPYRVARDDYRQVIRHRRDKLADEKRIRVDLIMILMMNFVELIRNESVIQTERTVSGEVESEDYRSTIPQMRGHELGLCIATYRSGLLVLCTDLPHRPPLAKGFG